MTKIFLIKALGITFSSMCNTHTFYLSGKPFGGNLKELYAKCLDTNILRTKMRNMYSSIREIQSECVCVIVCTRERKRKIKNHRVSTCLNGCFQVQLPWVTSSKLPTFTARAWRLTYITDYPNRSFYYNT